MIEYIKNLFKKPEPQPRYNTYNEFVISILDYTDGLKYKSSLENAMPDFIDRLYNTYVNNLKAMVERRTDELSLTTLQRAEAIFIKQDLEDEAIQLKEREIEYNKPENVRNRLLQSIDNKLSQLINK